MNGWRIIWHARALCLLCFTLLFAVCVSITDANAQVNFGMPPQPSGVTLNRRVVPPHCQVLQIPAPKVKSAGFKCVIDMGAIEAAGYVPLRYQVDAIGTFPADRSLLLRLRGQGVLPPTRDLVIDVPIEIREGARSVTEVVYVPRWAAVGGVTVSIWEDGRFIPDHVGVIDNPVASTGSGLVRSSTVTASDRYRSFGWIVAAKDVQDAEGEAAQKFISQNLPFPPAVSSWTPQNWFAGDLGRRAIVLDADALTSDWRAYQRFDALICGRSLVGELQKESQSWLAIKQWVMMGGMLVVTDSEDSESTMRQLKLSVATEELSAVDVGATAAALHPDWVSMRGRLQRELQAGAQLGLGQPAGKSNGNAAVLTKRELQVENWLRMIGTALRRSNQQWQERIWMQPCGAGRIVGIRSGSSVADVEIPDLDVVGALLGFRTSPMLRRGVDPMLGDSRFKQWLIPGVAQPPVYMFIGLLSLFVILVGPVAYRQTSKRKRTHFMFVIAPVLALATTVMMFGYGILADGFGISSRVRQITLVDGRSGEGVERIRSTYFAGISPGGSLRFDGQDEVMSYPDNQAVSFEELAETSGGPAGRVVIKSDSQRFDGSMLPSRQQTQFVVHRVRPKIGSVSFSTTTSGVPQITNGLGFTFNEMVLRDIDGKYWQAGQVVSDTAVMPEMMDDKIVSKTLGEMYNRHRLIMPIGYRSPTNRQAGEQYDFISDLQQDISPSLSIIDGAFEFELQRFLQTTNELPCGYFLAIADVSDDAYCLNEVDDKQGVRYVMGTYVVPEPKP